MLGARVEQSDGAIRRRRRLRPCLPPTNRRCSNCGHTRWLIPSDARFLNTVGQQQPDHQHRLERRRSTVAGHRRSV